MKENIITKRSENYPLFLKEIYNPPEKLFYKGNPEILQKTCIAVVGTRRYSDYGEFITNRIIEELKVLDIAIVSGLAKGIDAIAHKSALINDIPTIAVLGSGLENIYPKQNLKLAEEIAKKGLLLSEYEPEISPIALHFPQRNRIISGLSIATIVIEAPEKSGALITAKLALDQNREIFTVPGDVDNENSLGPLRLLQKSGAYAISSGRDVIDELKKQPYLFEIPSQTPNPKNKTQPPQTIYNLTQEETEILSLIPKHRNIHLDQIAQKTTIPTREILSALSLLEIKDILQTKDGKYSRKC